MSYNVKTDVFEGPFDLLVYLIERAGVDIYAVNISEITDQYIEYARSVKYLNPETAAEFMLLAATLLQIKSKMLLPVYNNPDQEADDDPRDELAQRIIEYKKIKQAAADLRKKEEYASAIFTKPAEDITQYTDQPEEILQADINDFIDAFAKFLERRQRVAEMKRRYEYAAVERMTMEAKSDYISSRLKTKRNVMFSELIQDDTDVYDVVLTFITLLEMLVRGTIIVSQKSRFGDISVSRREDGKGGDAGARTAGTREPEGGADEEDKEDSDG